MSGLYKALEANRGLGEPLLRPPGVGPPQRRGACLEMPPLGCIFSFLKIIVLKVSQVRCRGALLGPSGTLAAFKIDSGLQKIDLTFDQKLMHL